MCLAVFDGRVTNQGLEITLLGLTVRKIPLSKIADVNLGSKGVSGEVWTVFE